MRPGVLLLLALLLPPIAPSAPQRPPCAIVAFGDSITWGAYASQDVVPAYLPNRPAAAHLVGSSDTSYPGDLARMRHTSVCNYGIPGEMAEQGRVRLHGLLGAYRPERLVLLEGVNDLPSDRTNTQIAGDLRAMVRDTRSHRIAIVLSTLTPTFYPPSDSHFYLNHLVRSINVVIRRLARTDHIPLADAERSFLHDGRGAKLTADYLHPNDVGYRLLAHTISAAITRTVHRQKLSPLWE